MTLRQDCELWATFDSEDVDSQRGIVRDRSGKGRTLEASGGPTYGQNSPVGEAVAFDGTDDVFAFDNPFSDGQEFSIAVLAKPESEAETTLSGESFDTLFDVHRKSSRRFFDDTHKALVAEQVPLDKYELTVFQSPDGQDKEIYGDTGKLLTRQENSTDITLSLTTVGSGVEGNWNGEIAFIGGWSRALSDSEIEELTRMTDRMVSKL